MQEAGFEEVDVYALRRHNTVAHYIVTRPIMEIYEEMIQRPGTWVAQGSGIRRDWTWW